MDIAYDLIMTQLGALLGSVTFIFNGLIALISSIYILSESNKIIRFVKRVINKFMPKKAADVTRVYVRKTHNYFKKYINCVLIDCLAMGIVAPIVLLILGSPHALTLGLLLGVMNFIPVFGSIFATLIAIIVVLLTQGLEMGVIAAIVLLVIQRIDADIFQPRLYGNSLRLSPLLVIISITVGGAIGNAISGFGGMVIGMFIAIPCMKVISNIVEDVLGIEDASGDGNAVSGDGVAPADGAASDAPESEPAKEKSAFVQWIKKLNRPIGRRKKRN
jgi:predicted PurR-regulated permease PerM